MKNAKSPGRPRAFNPDEALDKALRMFWLKGYEGTSLSDLTEAMGINRPSLYAAFGNKEELFHKAFARYSQQAASITCAPRECVKVRESVEKLLYGAAEAMADPEHPGCLSIVGALACSEESESVRQSLCSARKESLDAWQARFEKAKAESDLPTEADPAALAQYIMVVLAGMTVQARGGATRDDLRQVAKIALDAWPS